MPKVKVNDVEIYYETHGEGEPLLMIPGWGGSTKSYSAFSQILSKYYKFIVMDNRGAGQSSKPDISYTIRTMAEDVAGFMDSISLENAFILGGSMGGMIAQVLAAKYKEKVDKLVLACTSCGGSNSIPFVKETMDIIQLYIDLPGKLTYEERVTLLMEAFYTPEFLEGRREQLLADRLTRTPSPSYALQRQLEAIMLHDSYELLPEIKSPTLILHGKKDVLIPYKNALILKERIPNSEVRIYEKTGHFLAEEGAQILKDILNFLQT